MSSKYQVGPLLGRGGMAETFEATRIKTEGHGFRVALKLALPELLGHSEAQRQEFIARFSQEARIGAQLDHPSIVRVVDTGTLDGRPYLAMQLIEGLSLSKLLRACAQRGVELPPVVLTHLACDLAAALEYAHRHQVLHRDVTPGNVLLSLAGECRLSDFGIARLVTEDLGLTLTKAFMGKIPYVAPEVFYGMADELSDLYSLGVTLAESATGRRLFPASTVNESLASRTQVDVEALLTETRSDLPGGFAALVGALTSHDRNDRPTAEQALDRLELMVGNTTSTAERQLAGLVQLARSESLGERDEELPPPPTEPGTATLIAAHECLIQDIINRNTAAAYRDAALVEELLAAGHLALLEAKREYDPDNAARASFTTFARPRVQRAVVDAIAAYGGVPRGMYRGAQREAALAREEASDPLDVHTEQWVARNLNAAEWGDPEPFTEAGRAIELRDVHRVIEQIPSPRERELLRLVELEGLTQKAAGEKLGISQPVAYESLKSARRTLRDLLLVEHALAPAKLSSTIEELPEPAQRDVIRLLYMDRLDPASARKALRLREPDFQALHRDALQTIKDLVVGQSC